MNTAQLTPDFHVATQIKVEDIAALKDAGFTHIICNRPDFESAPEDAPDLIGAAARKAGLGFSNIPFMPSGIRPEDIADQAKPTGKVLAYCASGTRSAILWALSQAGKQPTDDILATMSSAGFPMEQIRGQLDMMAKQGN